MDYRKEFRVDSDRLRLNKLDPAYKGKHASEAEAKQETENFRQKLAHLQAVLYAEHKHAILVVLQALDAGGKDGTINHVFSALNPQGARVAGFKQPTAAELAHDFLWRVHAHAPGRGEIAIFNRSHYEDVLVPRVHKQIDKTTLTTREKDICGFESLLARSGTTLLKIFLYISKEEQLARFAQRLDDPGRNWKISESDYAERKYWDDYIEAFEQVIPATSAKGAPWYVIPSNHKWFRNLAVSQIIADTIEELKLAFPPPAVDLNDIRRRYHSAEKEQKAGKKKA